MQMKNTLTHIVNYEKTIFDKKSNLNLQPENLAGYYLCKGIFICFSLPWKILHKRKVKQLTELAETLWLFA